MISSLRIALIGSLISPLFPFAQSSAVEHCASKHSVARNVLMATELQGSVAPEFKITSQSDGQAILYWDHGAHSRIFYAVTFRTDGCAILTDTGSPRRLIFPKSAYNTGVFYEMDAFDVL